MNTNNLVTIKTDGVQHHAKFTAAGQCYVYYDEMNNEVWSYSANISPMANHMNIYSFLVHHATIYVQYT